MNILILGASIDGSEERRGLYQSMVDVCSRYGEVSSPIDTDKFEGDKYSRAFRKVDRANLIIGEQSEPSTGQGMEIGYSLNNPKPILVVAKEGSKVSGLVRDCPHLKGIVYYSSVGDLEVNLGRALEEIVNGD